jgi:L-alanine-DL-glutamate epimerase-like enolase superfamily enzyme
MKSSRRKFLSTAGLIGGSLAIQPLSSLYMLQMVSACPNADRFHEFKVFQTKDANGTIIPIESKTEPFSSVDGVIKVPTGSGLGINIDPEYIKTHKTIL